MVFYSILVLSVVVSFVVDSVVIFVVSSPSLGAFRFVVVVVSFIVCFITLIVVNLR